MKTDRFRRRRLRLVRRHLCTRCAVEKARKGHKTCTACCVVMAIKDKDRRARQRVDLGVKKAALVYRLSLIEEAKSAITRELESLSA